MPERFDPVPPSMDQFQGMKIGHIYSAALRKRRKKESHLSWDLSSLPQCQSPKNSLLPLTQTPPFDFYQQDSIRQMMHHHLTLIDQYNKTYCPQERHSSFDWTIHAWNWALPSQ